MGQVCRNTKVLAQLRGNAKHVAHTFERRITILLDQRAVRLRDFCQVRRVDDQLAAFFDYRAKLITRLSTNPQLVVMRIEQRDHSLVLPSRVADVNLSTNFRRTPKTLAYLSRETRVA